MKLEDQVVSLELAKKLQELGVKQTSYFYWWVNRYGYASENKLHVQDHIPNNPKEGWRWCSAFTVAELGEMLPVECDSGKTEEGTIAHVKGKWVAIRDAGGDLGEKQYADTEADARAKMLIYLLENRLLEPARP
jgi:hypothetical protein